MTKLLATLAFYFLLMSKWSLFHIYRFHVIRKGKIRSLEIWLLRRKKNSEYFRTARVTYYLTFQIRPFRPFDFMHSIISNFFHLMMSLTTLNTQLQRFKDNLNFCWVNCVIVMELFGVVKFKTHLVATFLWRDYSDNFTNWATKKFKSRSFEWFQVLFWSFWDSVTFHSIIKVD